MAITLAGGGSRRRKAARRSRAHESYLWDNLIASMGKKVKAVRTIVGPHFTRGKCRAIVKAGVKSSSVVSARQGRPKGSIAVIYRCDIGGAMLEDRKGYKSLQSAESGLKDFFRAIK
jgi:hypothetical protein